MLQNRLRFARVNHDSIARMGQPPDIIVAQRRNGPDFDRLIHKEHPLVNPPAIVAFSSWLSSPLGQYLAEQERAWLARTVDGIFGFVAVQMDVPELDGLVHNRMPNRWRVGWQGDVRCEEEQLPLATASVDLMILPHGFDFSADPHQLLREVDRVLVPDGRLVLTGFNPMSLWGMRRLGANRELMPWQGRFLRMNRVKDWLTLLNFEVIGGAMMAYCPPLNTCRWRQRFDFMEAAGDRWWPIGGAVYGLHAIKRTAGMRLIRPQWQQPRLSGRLAAWTDKQSLKSRDEEQA